MSLNVTVTAGWRRPTLPWLSNLLGLLDYPFSLCSQQLTFLSLQSSSTGNILSALLLVTLSTLNCRLKLYHLLCKDSSLMHSKLATFNKLADSLAGRAL